MKIKLSEKSALRDWEAIFYRNRMNVVSVEQQGKHLVITAFPEDNYGRKKSKEQINRQVAVALS